MSQREAAKVLGCDEKTIRNDLRNDSAEGADIIRTSRAANEQRRKAGAISAGFERARGPLHDVRVGTPSAKQLGYHK
jgi:hypothetical protein